MAPKKAVKRGDTTLALPASKKAKADPNLAGVAEALEQAADLPDGCRKMLLASLPHCFITPCTERHESQVEVVRMIGEVIQGVETALQTATDDESSKVAEVEASRAGLEAVVKETVEAQTAAVEEVTGKTAAVAEAAAVVKAANAHMQEADEAQRVGDVGLCEARQSKAAFEKGIESDLQAIVEGQGEAEQHYQALLPLLGGLSLDESLLSALPSTCKKIAAERGPFDAMVLEQLGACLKGQVASLTKNIEEAMPASQEHASAMEAAQAELVKATERHEKAAGDLEEAVSGQKVAAEKAAAANEALSAFEPEYANATKGRDEKVAVVENFRLYNVECFKMLRDRASPRVAVGGA